MACGPFLVGVRSDFEYVDRGAATSTGTDCVDGGGAAVSAATPSLPSSLPAQEECSGLGSRKGT